MPPQYRDSRSEKPCKELPRYERNTVRMHPSALLGLLTFAAVASALPSQGSASTTPSSIQNLKDKIKNVVVLVMENRSFDNLLGGQTLPGLNNPIQSSSPICNPYNVSNPLQGNACSQANDYDSITDDPDHAVYGNNFEFYGTFTPNNAAIAAGTLTPSMQGFVQEQIRGYGSKASKTDLGKQVMNYYTEAQVPTLTALVQNFVTFNYWHSGVPGVSSSIDSSGCFESDRTKIAYRP